MGQRVGIDLGTTNSAVAVYGKDGPRVVPFPNGDTYLPSAVGMDPLRGLVLGKPARDLAREQPDACILSVKRHMGTEHTFVLGDFQSRPQDVSALILRDLRRAAEAYLQSPVDSAVISVPAYFNEVQRRATREAGEIAGIRVERLVSEPTAAALAYGLDRLDTEDCVLVYDLGGGTFDVSVLEMFEGIFSVRACSGDSHLGGDDFDQLIYERILEAADRRLRGRHLAPEALGRCRHAAESTKIRLSAEPTTEIRLDSLPCFDGGTIDVEMELSREAFNALTRGLLKRTGQCVLRALAEAKVPKERIGEVILVGGATRMPMVRKFLTEMFGKAPRDTVNPMEAVALGAAIQGHLLEPTPDLEHIVVTDVSPFTLGVAVLGEFAGKMRPGVFDPLIHRNSTLPAKCSKVFSTTHPEQESVAIEIYQGDDPLVENNVFLDRYYLGGIPKNAEHAESLEITFEYDCDGILHVSAVVVSTGRSAGIRIDTTKMKAVGQGLIAARSRVSEAWERSLPRRTLEELLQILDSRMDRLSPEERATLAERVSKARTSLEDGDRTSVEEWIAELRPWLQRGAEGRDDSE